MPHTTARRFKPRARLELAQLHWWQARKADVLTVAPRWSLKAKLCDSIPVWMPLMFTQCYRVTGKL